MIIDLGELGTEINKGIKPTNENFYKYTYQELELKVLLAIAERLEITAEQFEELNNHMTHLDRLVSP